MLDISREPMEVAPTAHYSMGGVVVDPDTTATEVEGLFAAGEVTSGLHGANRLGGNSLAETVVFGRRAGEHAAALATARDVSIHPGHVIQEANAELEDAVRPGTELARPLQRAVRDVMWKRCGVVRDEAGLRRGLSELRDIAAAVGSVDISPNEEGWDHLGHLFDLRVSLAAAEVTLLGAIERKETRGAHYRADFLRPDDELRVSFRERRDGGGRVRIDAVPAPPVPDHLRAWVDRAAELEVAGDRLLE
jgi:succinate dehydrogenase / fumarate reductase flavoprotein subunit